MQYSQQGMNLTEGFEACRLIAYQDIRGIWTIGWGHTGPEVCEGLTWTQEQADAQLLADLQRFVDDINNEVNVPLTQGEFDALVDFTFNDGNGAFMGSTLLRLLNAGDYDGAAAQFPSWDHAAGVVVAGLLRRRQAEVALFKGQDNG
jgi:lysozyme